MTNPSVPDHTHACAGCGVLVLVPEQPGPDWAERPYWCRACGGTADRPTPIATFTVRDGVGHYVVRVVEVLEGGLLPTGWAIEVPGQQAQTFTTPDAAQVAALEFTGWRDAVHQELNRQAAEADLVSHGITTSAPTPEVADDQCLRCGHAGSAHGDLGCAAMMTPQPCGCPVYDEPF